MMGGWKAVAAGAAMAFAMVAGGVFAHENLGPPPKTPAGKAAFARHHNFKQLGAGFKAILDEIKKGQPDNTVVSSNAAKLKGLASQLPSWFPKGSGAESGVKSDAKPEVWADPAGFAAAANRLQVETSKLDQFARAGDLPGVREQVRAVGGACKNCHDKYRKPERR